MFKCLFLITILQLTKYVSLECGCDQLNRDNKVKYFKEQQCFDVVKDMISKEPKFDKMSLIPGGFSIMGTNNPVFYTDRESPEKSIKIDSFYLDKYEVSNKDFQEFVENTNYLTTAEKFNDSFIFQSFLTRDAQEEFKDFRVANALWWYKINGVNWRHPYGPDSNIEDLMDHPVVHVSWIDAVEYCKWQKKRLPTEAEWETACRGGRNQKLFPWGNKEMPRNEHWMNIWQGSFPNENTKDDGFESTCPVTKFRQNNFDIYNIVGNVWEWTADLWDTDNIEQSEYPNRVKKGGSYLCHKSYCFRYRCAARSQNTEDSSAGNLGFRCAKSL